jgi:hypothetical protein
LKKVYFYAIQITMGYLNHNKLNRLLGDWPSGTVALSSWLKKEGYSNPLLSKYRKNLWMSSIGHDANVRPNDKVNWTGGLYALQEQLHLPVHAGGKTALQLHGYAHFLPDVIDTNREGLADGTGFGGGAGAGVGTGLGTGSGDHFFVTLFSPPGMRIPSWFLQHDWGIKIYHTMTKLLPYKDALGLTRKEMGGFSIRVSAPERAIMEVLYLVPKKESYEEAKLLMEGLSTLRPELVKALLKNCRSIKVKRLFMHLAETCNLPWLTKLDTRNINFGNGKRVVVKGGYFDSKYNISVPGPRPGQSTLV